MSFAIGRGGVGYSASHRYLSNIYGKTHSEHSLFFCVPSCSVMYIGH